MLRLIKHGRFELHELLSQSTSRISPTGTIPLVTGAKDKDEGLTAVMGLLR